LFLSLLFGIKQWIKRGKDRPGLFFQKILYKIMSFFEFMVLLSDRSKIEYIQIKKSVFKKNLKESA